MSALTRCLRWVVFASVLVLAASPAAQAKGSVSGCSTISTGGLLAAASGGESVPIELSTPLEAPLLTTFGVLRRAAVPSDGIPALSPVGGELDSQIASYYPAYVRELKALPNGVRYFVVPGFPVAETVPPTKCLSPALRAERPKLVERAREHAAELVYCIASLGSMDGQDACTPFSEVGKSPTIFQEGALLSSAVELVPDGVSSVRFDYGTSKSIVDAVSENSFLFAPPHDVVREGEAIFKRLAGHVPHHRHPTKAQIEASLKLLVKGIAEVAATTAPSKLEWLNAAGAPIRTILAPKRHGNVLPNL
jgi:hypothetical protein